VSQQQSAFYKSKFYNNSASGHAIFQIHVPTPLVLPLLWGIGTKRLKITCSDAEINENKMYESTFLFGHPLSDTVMNNECLSTIISQQKTP
jgi:hypothetical protein